MPETPESGDTFSSARMMWIADDNFEPLFLGTMLRAWVEQTPWITFLAKEERIRSHASVCLSVVAPWYEQLPADGRAASIRRMTDLLATEGAAFDIQANPMAPPGLRIWCGCTVERDDIEALLPWLDWAYEIVKVEYELCSLASA
jgi:phosphoserine aminotransferase